MTVLQLLEGVEVVSRSGPPQSFGRVLSGLHYDSRRIQPDSAFVAMKGESTDGNSFIDAALMQGAIAIVTDSAREKPRPNTAWVQVVHGRRALAALAANFYGHPARQLKITGVTGTNGKTTTTFLLAQMLQFLRRGDVALMGTIEYHFAGQVVSAPHTTPEALELNQIFAQAVAPGPHRSTEAVMEVSSHALAQQRISGISYDVAVFTNLTRDHLDYHETLEDYFAAKQLLFTGCAAPPPRVAVINSDDPYGRRLYPVSKSAGSERMAYGLGRDASLPDVTAEQITFTPNDTQFRLCTPLGAALVRSPLVGRVNLLNLLAASAAAQARGASLEDIVGSASQSQSAPGRFERVDCGQPFSVIVDYAHTDDALRNLTALARELAAQNQNKDAQGKPGRVITLFGCGGDRDRSKRPLMGEAAGQGSDFVVLTSDNPRSEDPRAIIAEAEPGLLKTGVRYAVELDRRQAIALVIAE
ncbi:MAG: UDP-N-acetylmuramoyl-L-alanyl-D-glutamate--2,6-diaminopimelate ligase, partial [Steroidobacteraceae bacterium]